MELWERRRFIAEKAKAEIRGKRNSTVAGQLWAVLDPLFQAALYFFLITVLRGGGQRQRRGDLSSLVFCVFLFNLTQGALNEGGRSIVSSKSLILNSSFPRAMLPIAAIYKGLLGLTPCAAIYLDHPRGAGPALRCRVGDAPLLLAHPDGDEPGVAMLVATLNVFVRDVGNAMTYISRVLFFTTPVIYPADDAVADAPAILVMEPLLLAVHLLPGGAGGRHTRRRLRCSRRPSSTIVLFVLGARVFLSHERAFAMRL